MANKLPKKKAYLRRLPTANQSTGLLFLQAGTLWRRNVELALHPYGITYVQFVLLEALSYLTRSGEQISQNDLAAFTKRDVTITSQVLRMLEKRNLVTRVTDQNDARTRKLAVTEAGVIVLETAMKIVDAADKQFFATLGNKQEAFTTCLQELITAEDAEK
jgi:DNA-binding MarR family transcriptional regulator